jgi:hypothetical protein
LKRRLLHRYGIALALMGLAFRLFIVAVHVPPGAATQTSNANSLFSQIVLCTAQGLRIVKLDENGKPADPSQSPGSAQGCPICTSLSGAPLALAPALNVLPVPEPLAALFRAELRSALVIGHAPLVVRGRDPPLQA